MAFTVTSTKLSGIEPSWIGVVSSKVAVGNCEVFMMRPRNWPSRCARSDDTEFMSTVKVPVSTVAPLMVIAPVTDDVRPVAVADAPNNVSLTR